MTLELLWNHRRFNLVYTSCVHRRIVALLLCRGLLYFNTYFSTKAHLIIMLGPGLDEAEDDWSPRGSFSSSHPPDSRGSRSCSSEGTRFLLSGLVYTLFQNFHINDNDFNALDIIIEKLMI